MATEDKVEFEYFEQPDTESTSKSHQTANNKLNLSLPDERFMNFTYNYEDSVTRSKIIKY